MKEQRREYLRQWREKNKESRYAYRRAYYRKRKDEGTWLYGNHKKVDTETGETGLRGTCNIGRKYELLALRILRGSKDCNDGNFSGKWDIEWNGFKVDVKMRQKNKNGLYGFTTKKNPEADYYLLFCVDKDRIQQVLFVPKTAFGTGIGVIPTVKTYTKYAIEFSQELMNAP